MHLSVVGTHDYQWALWPFAALFLRYWGPETVEYCGDRLDGDLPANLAFVQVPAYRMGEWPWQHWFGNGLASYLETVQDPIVGLFLPDHWIRDPVNLEAAVVLEAYLLAHDDVVRGCLAGGTALDQHGDVVCTWDGIDIVSVPPDHPHASLDGGMAFCPSLWNRRRLLNLVEPGWTLWQCEALGTRKMAQRGLRSVGTWPPALWRAAGLSHADGKVARLEGLRGEDWALVRSHLPNGWRVEG